MAKARVLLTNDDGIDSPLLLPLAGAMRPWAEVHIVVPATERSWIGKAITRFAPVRVERRNCGEFPLYAVDGSPADCVNLAIHSLDLPRPDLVVSGVNLGLNFGLSFVLSSGTVGAAMESWIAGVPAIAFSMAIPNDAYGLSGAARARALGARIGEAAAVASELAETLWRHGMPPGVDLFSVNFPAELTRRTPRRLTDLARTRYGPLFVPASTQEFRHSFHFLEVLEEGPNTDVACVRQGAIAITPIRLQLSAELPASLRAIWETSP